MSNYDTHRVWNQLVEINCPENIDGPEIIKEMLESCIMDQHKNKPEYEIKITEAGKFYSFILSDFEYFATRFAKTDIQPLFFNNGAIKTSGEYKNWWNNAETIINITTDSAIKCINEAFDFDTVHCGGKYKNLHSETSFLYKRDDSRQFATHPLRVSDSFIRYLDIYRRYILSTAIEKKEQQLNIYSELSCIITQKIKTFVSLILDTFVDKQDDDKIYYMTGNIQPPSNDLIMRYKKYRAQLEELTVDINNPTMEDIESMQKIKIAD